MTPLSDIHPMSFIQRHSKSLLILVSMPLILAACGEHKAATQVAAKVNKNEISVHQINNALSRTPNLTPEQAKVASKQVLEKLVEQELMVEQAVEKKIDRDPKVMMAIESAKREILSRAYLEQLTSGLTKPTASEVADFYGKHPELFSDRRVFNINELSAKGGADLLPKLKERMAKAKSLAEVADWLKEQKIPVAVNNTTKAAEQLPMELLPRFQQMKDGEIGVIPTPEGVLVVQLAASKAAPIDERSAIPMVEQYLTNQRRMEMVTKEMKQLREKATVEYLGDFAKTGAGESTAKTENAAPTQPTTAQAESVATPAVVDKAVAGLK
ncbi:MAG: peptidyl-prolyl cis-trans isomerase, EpsD family [Rhodocyclaceae bacterium]|nr:MAG: peptidyl-prolyl cis-trans isomerase, EpsD family [Rhodocyclaceae bacterium]